MNNIKEVLNQELTLWPLLIRHFAVHLPAGSQAGNKVRLSQQHCSLMGEGRIKVKNRA